MGLEKYKAKYNLSKTSYTFVSEGLKGSILKGVLYERFKLKGYKNLYNLSFGDKDEDTGDIDDLIVTDNDDRDKVLATVVNTAQTFLESHPKAQIFITGSSPARTRLYRMAIGKYLEELSETLDIQGYTKEGWKSFEKNNAYVGFLVKLKNNRNEK